MAVRPALDPDLGWHLRTGQWIASHGTVPRTNPFSFTRDGAPWVAHEWLTELGMDALAGLSSPQWPFAGLILAFATLTAGAFWISLRTILARHPGEYYVAGTFAALAALTAIPSYGVRPQILTLLLFSLTLWWLERVQQEQPSRWWLGAFAVGIWSWANLHAGFAAGLALVGLTALGTLLDGLSGATPLAEARPRVIRLTGALVAGVAAVVVNPNGVRLYSYPLETLASPAMAALIREWASPNFHREVYWPFAALLLLTLTLLALSPRRARPSELLTLAAFLLAALYSARHVPLFALVVAPILASQSIALLDEASLRWPRLRSLTADAPNAPVPISGNFPLLAAALLALMLAFAALQVSHVLASQAQEEARTYPAAAVAWLRANPAPPHLFNDYNWGGYLLWNLPDTYRVAQDGRADLYGDAWLEQYADLVTTGRDASARLLAIGAQTALIPPDGPLAQALRSDAAHWDLRYQDRQAAVFVARTVASPAPSH